jgi:hypothetical protein
MNGMTKSLRALLQSDISELAKLGDAGQFPTMGLRDRNHIFLYAVGILKAQNSPQHQELSACKMKEKQRW